MKIIDEKGKLFRVINIIDLVVVLAIIAIAFVGVYKTSVMKKVNVLDNKKAYQMQILIKSVLPEMVEQVASGDTFLEDSSNNVLGQIKKVEANVTKNEVQTSDGRVVVAEVKNRRDVILTVNGEGMFDDVKGLTFGNKDWQAGGAIVIKSNKVKFLGNIYKIELK